MLNFKALAVKCLAVAALLSSITILVNAETFTPGLQGAKTFGKDQFDIDYSVGNINIQDTNGVNQLCNPNKLPLIKALDPVYKDTYFYYVSNTQKESDIYIDHYNAAKYKDSYLDIREYVWVSHTGAGIASDTGWHNGYLIDLFDLNNVLYREFHFYKAGTLKLSSPQEVQFKGIMQFTDFDQNEGVWINNLNDVYLNNPTWVKLTEIKDGHMPGTKLVVYLGTVEGLFQIEQTFWAEVAGLPEYPLIIKYILYGKHGGKINFEGTTYTGKLTYNSNNYSKETTEQIISLGYDVTVSENMFDTIEGFEFTGWNTKADGTGTSYTPNQVAQFNSATTLYAMWKVSDEFPNTPKVTIDMTFAQAGGGVECNHVWEVKHGTLDQSGNPVALTGKTTHHWEQCWKCGTIINLEKHTMKNTTDGENTCNPGTPQLVARCTGLDGRCNYSENVPKPAHEVYTLDKADNAWVWGYHVAHRCKNCNIEMEPTTQWCRDANGNKLGCGTAGTCATCGFTYDSRHLALTTDDDYWNIPGVDGNWSGDLISKSMKLHCFTCKKEFGQVDFTMHRDGNTEGRNYTVDYNISLNPGVSVAVNFKEGLFDSTNGDHGNWNYSSGNLMTSGVRDYDITINGTKIDPTKDVKTLSGLNNKMLIRVKSYPSSTVQYLYSYLWLGNNGNWLIDGQPQAASTCLRHMVPNELGRPIYLDHKTTDERVPNVPANQLNGTAGWSTKLSITVSFADLITSDNNALNNVWLGLWDKDGNIIYNWTPGTRSSYSSQYPQNKYTSTFDIVAEIKGTQTLRAVAHDATWNTNEYLIQVQNIDTLAPQPANEFVTSQEWLRTKDFSYLFTDKGIGHIQVSFNNDSNEYGDEQDIYRFANTTNWENYSRDYLLTGDVTGAAGVTIYAKDLLGNAASYRATVYNLDNTKPTVTEVTVDGGVHDKTKTAKITGYNDFCEKIQKEGSGVVKFAVKKALEDGSAPEVTDKDFQDSNTFTGLEAGTYYAYVKDRVDWVSEPYVFYVDTYSSTPEVTIDMTFVQAGGGINCDHIFEAKYDAQYHWEQCWKCGTIRNKSTHHLVVDSGLYNSCWSGAPKVMAHCDGMDGKCNHYEYLPKPAHEAKDLVWINDSAGVYHYHLCKNCTDWIDIEKCTDKDENRLGCGTAGTCAYCNAYYDGRHLLLKTEFVYEGLLSTQQWRFAETYREYTQDLYCLNCEKLFGTVKLKQTKDTSDPEGRTVNVIWDIQMNPGVSIDFGRGAVGDRLVGGGYSTAVNPNTWNILKDSNNKVLGQTIKEYNTSGQVVGNLDKEVNWKSGRFLLGYTFKSFPDAHLNEEWLVLGPIGNEVAWLLAWKLNGVTQYGAVKLDYNAFPDTQAPYYLEGLVNVVNSESGNQNIDGVLWLNKATVLLEFYDTLILTGYLETDGFVKFYDKDMNPLTDWEPAVKNGLYNKYQKLYKAKDIVAEARGTQPIYVEFKDKTGNISEPLELQIQNLDALAPQPVNEFETSQEWSRTKDFSYIFKDEGIGHVEISFNNNSYDYGTEQDIYKPGNTEDTVTYSRDYKLTGDVTGSAGVTIYAKDRLGNTASYKALVYNLDNTKPTITDVLVSGTSTTHSDVTILGYNDFCDKIQKEGSGVKKFALVAANPDGTAPTPDALAFQESNKFLGVENGVYYAYVMDGVDWISDPYKVEMNDYGSSPKVTIDMTFVQEGGGVNCKHVWEAKADATYHWEQCWKCGQVKENSKTKHNLYYLNGITQSTCNMLEKQAVQLCSGLDGKCTYEHVVPRPAHVSGPWVDTSYGHARACINCGNDLDNQRCTNLSGQLLGCGTAGTCAVCGQYWNGTHGNLDVEVENYDGWGGKLDLNYKQMKTDIKCLICGQKFGTAEYGAVRFQDTTNKTRVKVKVTLNSGITANLNGLGVQTALAQLPNSTNALLTDLAIKLQTLRVNGFAPPTLDNQLNTFELQYDYEAYDTAQPNYLVLWLLKYPNSLGAWYINGVKQQGRICFGYFGMYPDTRAPEVLTSEFQVTNNAGQSGTVDGYSTKYNIKAVIFDEGITSKNTNNSVEVRVFNSKNELIKDWTKATKTANNRYTLSFEVIDEIRDEENIYIEARDQSGNISKKTPYLVRKIDNLDPQPVNKFETTQEWLRTKDFRYLFTDRGIGHIDISFNNPSYKYGLEQDIYKPGNTVDTIEYSRDYTLTGDVTGAAGVTIYAKDKLGNEAAYPAIVYNLDNTKPTIRECVADYENLGANIGTTLSISKADDFCEKIQNEGSGIAGYAVVKVPGDADNQPAAPATPDESQFERRNTWDIDESAWYFVYAIDNVQWISDPYPIYVEKVTIEDEKILATAVDATAANGHGGINLDWLFKDWNTTTNKAWQAQAGENDYEGIINNPDKWVPVLLMDLTMEAEPVYVLNIIPLADLGPFGTLRGSNSYETDLRRLWTFPEYDWNGYPTGKTYQINMVQYAGLKAWMEGGLVDVIYHHLHGSDDIIHQTNPQYQSYGQSQYTGQQVIRVIPVYALDFMKDPNKYLSYDSLIKEWVCLVDMHLIPSTEPGSREVPVSSIMIGLADADGTSTDWLQSDQVDILEQFLGTGGLILTGHDTLLLSGTEPEREMTQLLDRFGVWEFLHNPDKVKWHITGGTDVIVTKSGLLTNFPWELPLGTHLTIPLSHTVANSSYGNVWMEFNRDNLLVGGDQGNLDAVAQLQGNCFYYLTTNANTAMIQTGHSSGASTPDEQKIIANTLFYLKQTSSYNKATDNSAQDFSAPDKVLKIDIQNTELDTVGVTVERPKDNGTAYTHVAQQFLKTNVAEKFGMDNGNIGITNFVLQEVITGTKGYYYYVDAKNNQTISLQDGIVTTSTGIKFDNANKGVANVENPNTIYNKELIIEYLRETIESPLGGLESITVNQNSNTDKSIRFNINSKALREQFTENVVYLHIAPYDNAGNIGETILVPIYLDKIVYMPNGGIDSNGTTNPAVQNIIVGQKTTIYGTIFTKEGFRFKGWNTAEDGSGTQYNAGGTYVFNKLMMIYAQWDKVLSLTVDPNKGWWIDSGKVTVKPGLDDAGIDKDPTGQRYEDKVSFNLGEGDIKEIPDALRYGYNFYGWKILLENQLNIPK